MNENLKRRKGRREQNERKKYNTKRDYRNKKIDGGKESSQFSIYLSVHLSANFFV